MVVIDGWRFPIGKIQLWHEFELYGQDFRHNFRVHILSLIHIGAISDILLFLEDNAVFKNLRFVWICME